MSRHVDINLIAHLIVESTTPGCVCRDSVQRQYERLTLGLVEYERQQVAWLVNFKLSSPVL